MKLQLTKSDDELRAAFFCLSTRADVAELLEVSERTLIYLVYRNKDKNYGEFSVPKKSGGQRIIHAPVSSFKILQRKLSYVLYLVHKPKSSAHGFMRDRSIKTNAEGHVRAKRVFNIDLIDFFGAITIQRLIGLFMKKPYEISREAAVVLAQICCSPFGYLPQGAPTSPIISNMICSRLDGELRKLAYETRCMYTRYADDITFSSSKVFSGAIVNVEHVDGKLIAAPGEILRQTIEGNGFSINPRKVKYRTRATRQEITGLIVNERVNVKRKLLKQIRAMLHSYRMGNFPDEAAGNHLLRRIDGKLNFVRSIRSGKDRAYRVLVNQYNAIVGRPLLPVDAIEEIKWSIWFLEVDGKANGTAFMLNDHQLITCYHVIGLSADIKACRWEADEKISYRVSPVKKSASLDIATLKFEDPLQSRHDYSLSQGNSANVKPRHTVTVLGFPYYTDQKTIIYDDVKILGIKEVVVPLFFVSPRSLVSGMSGGPAINTKNEVVGVVAFGALNVSEAEKQDVYGIIPINFLSQLS